MGFWGETTSSERLRPETRNSGKTALTRVGREWVPASSGKVSSCEPLCPKP